MKNTEQIYKDEVTEFHDFIVDDENETYIPPAVMEGYVPGKSYIPVTRNQKIRAAIDELKAITFGLAVGAVYSIFAYIGWTR